MARKLRLEFEDACYHVINRGNYRRDLFAKEGTAGSFETTLFEACERYGWRLHAYVIMRNHFHLAVGTPQPNLSAGMKWLQGTFAARFNRFFGQSGRPFQGRFKALLVEPGHALAQVVNYIHLNPVRAGVVPPERAREFRWSSLPRFLGGARPEFLVADDVLLEAGGLSDTPAGWRSYEAYLAWLATDDLAQKSLRASEMSCGWVVGTKEYGRALKKELAVRGAEVKRLEGASRDADAWRDVREQQWEEKLQAAARALKIDLGALPPEKSAPQKVILASALKTATGVSNIWLAERLAMGRPASSSQFVRRFRLAGGEASQSFKTALSMVKK